MRRFRTIVLGLGAMGSATLCQLARRGHRPLGIDRFSPPHANGSSHGDTRITRLAIGEGAHYTPLALRSHELWRELERETGARLLASIGGLFMSSPTQVVGVARARILRQHRGGGSGVRHRPRDSRRAHDKAAVSGVQRRGRRVRLLRAGGGVSPSRKHALPRSSRSPRSAVPRSAGTRWCKASTPPPTASPSRPIVATTLADRLVLTAGAWLPTLVGARIARHFTIYRQRLLWLAVDGDPVPFSPDRFPVFIWELQRRSQGIYGFPALDGPRGGVKIGVEQFATETTADADEGALPPTDIAAFHAEMIAPFLSGLAAAMREDDDVPLHGDPRLRIRHRRASRLGSGAARRGMLRPRLQALPRDRRGGGEVGGRGPAPVRDRRVLARAIGVRRRWLG